MLRAMRARARLAGPARALAFNTISLEKAFSSVVGNESSLSVCPVGAVSKTMTE